MVVAVVEDKKPKTTRVWGAPKVWRNPGTKSKTVRAENTGAGCRLRQKSAEIHRKPEHTSTKGNGTCTHRYAHSNVSNNSSVKTELRGAEAKCAVRPSALLQHSDGREQVLSSKTAELVSARKGKDSQQPSRKRIKRGRVPNKDEGLSLSQEVVCVSEN